MTDNAMSERYNDEDDQILSSQSRTSSASSHDCRADSDYGDDDDNGWGYYVDTPDDSFLDDW
jgi:hypothetical protein